MKSESISKRLRVYIPLVLVIILVLVGAWYWYRDYSRYITTDDAHVDADNVSVSSKIIGRLSAVYANEGDFVKQGTLLAEIDSSDIHAQRNQALAMKAQAETNLSQSELKYRSDQKSLKVLEINLDRATEDLSRAKSQSEGGVITNEQFDHIRQLYETAVAQLEAAKAQLLVSKSIISSASAVIETAAAQVKVFDTQLRNTKLNAPSDGIISKRWLLSGDVVQPGQSVFTLNNISAGQVNTDARGNMNIDSLSLKEIIKMVAAGKKIGQFELQLEQALKAYSLAETSFRSGVITNLDLLDANTAVSESKLMLLKARIDYAVSVYRLKAAMGERLY